MESAPEQPVTLVQPYNPDWPEHFEQVRAFVATALDGVDCSIEHVGSTSIPGMVAKPIIDLDIVISPGTFARIRARLETLGYLHQGDLGLPGREAFDLAEPAAKAGLPEHHLYVCDEGACELRKHLAFRDFMRRHPEWRAALSNHKLELCIIHANDRQAYIDGKSAMVQKITQMAMEQTG